VSGIEDDVGIADIGTVLIVKIGDELHQVRLSKLLHDAPTFRLLLPHIVDACHPAELMAGLLSRGTDEGGEG
jgi:hypothetical protein